MPASRRPPIPAGGARMHLCPTGRRLSLTPLIDVIFLLLLFFMLSSTFAREVELAVSAAAPGQAAGSTERPAFLSLGPGGLALNGQPVAQADLAGALEGEARLVLRPEPGVTAQALVDLLVLLARIDGLAVQVLA